MVGKFDLDSSTDSYLSHNLIKDFDSKSYTSSIWISEWVNRDLQFQVIITR